MAVADWDFQPAYVLCNPGTGQTAVWHLYNNLFSWSEYGPTLLAGWRLVAVAGFYGGGAYGDSDYLLFNPITGQTLIGYLSGTTLIRSDYGPTVPRGWALVATADFNYDGYPDYLLYNATTRQTAIWYMNKFLLVAPWGQFFPRAGAWPRQPVNNSTSRTMNTSRACANG